MLTELQRRALLDLARESVAARVAGHALAARVLAGLPSASGVFVTLKLQGHLRGCLGTLECLRDLAEDVVRCAADAASVDPRFSPVTPSQLAVLALEISVLGPLERIDPLATDAIVIGRHGLVVESGLHRGVLLPQVATEQRWTAEQFMRQTCIKANLAPDAWRGGAVLYRFVAEVFGD